GACSRSWPTVASMKSTPTVTMPFSTPPRTDYRAYTEPANPYQHAHVRRAISYAINRAALAKAVLSGNGKPANSLFPPQVPYYQPATKGLQYNLAAAKAEMAKSTVRHGFPRPSLGPPASPNPKPTPPTLHPRLNRWATP